MKIVSDFDGVLTDISDEARRVSEIFSDLLQSYTLLPPSTIQNILSTVENRMQDTPFSYGWHWEGKISAFCNEDGFVRVNAIGYALDRWADQGNPELERGRSLLASFGMTSYIELAQKAYTEMTAETAQGKHRPIEKEAIAALTHLISQGAEVVVVSNSESERIRNLLAANGMQADQGSRSVRVRGGAGKFKLGISPRPFAVEGASIDTDRPLYEKILTEERPDHVFGDVFSLDLALPLYLRRHQVEGLRGTRVWLRSRPYTPNWVKKLFGTQTFIKETEGGTFQNFGSLISSQAFLSR